MVAVPRQPWEQLDGEGDKAYRAFILFRDSGIPRSLPEVARAVSKSLPLMKRWSAKYRWAERARAWDQHHDAARTRASVKVAESDSERLARERLKRDDECLVIASRLKLHGLKMLEWPLEETVEETREVSPDGKTTVIRRTVQPALWRKRDAAIFLKYARDLEESVLTPPGEQIEQTIRRTAEVVDEGARRVADLRERMRAEARLIPLHPPGSEGESNGVA
jgi:hypothetical protein